MTNSAETKGSSSPDEDNRQSRKIKLINFLEKIIPPDASIEALQESESMMEAGLDSLAITEIIYFLETEFNIDLVQMGFMPEQFTSIESILSLIEREST